MVGWFLVVVGQRIFTQFTCFYPCWHVLSGTI